MEKYLFIIREVEFENVEEMQKELYLGLGAGDVRIENLVVTKEAKIDGGIGNIKK